ncbi:hypothetical protein MVEN_01025200 [Mycena venus]|uniref:SH3 domain-containing protein n=1 Tax=Mycena venus TaxID=2733690 RepID=A0A8H6YDA5_9AGAR|nr:hypothetical protein MVEN_01025200 [Mycena venus]
MSPFAYQEARASLISWWSDSNPGLQGPTINLHTAAKPLMKWMYYRQAVGIIKKRRGRPLSSETLDIYSSYLPLNYVSWATKVAIWSELADRATSQDDARMVVDSHIFPYIVQMLGSPDPRPRSWSCSLLGRLASHESTAPAILELKPCVQLTAFLHDDNLDVVREAMYALAQIARRIEGAQAIVEAKALERILKLLESPNPDIRGWTSQLVGRLASHDATAPAVYKLDASVQFASLLREEDSDLCQHVQPVISTLPTTFDFDSPPPSPQLLVQPQFLSPEKPLTTDSSNLSSPSIPPEIRLYHLEEENRQLNRRLQLIVEDFNAFRSSVERPEENSGNPSLRRQPSFKWAQYVSNSSTDLSSTLVPPKTARTESSKTLKSFKVSLDDPTWKVLPAALKKYRRNNNKWENDDNWENYAMFICYGSTDNRIERCLIYDEKPLLLFQKLKDAKKNPVFMLKHIKDIRSPIAVAQQKHAARKAPFIVANGSATTSNLNAGQGAAAPTMSPAPAWSRHESLKGLNMDPNDVTPNTSREMPPVSTSEVSYAIAIYPYMAEQEDELDVVVGDTFIILSRARGWWVVQRDPTGSGIVYTDVVRQGWVPAGCLLETKVPVASAIAEATAAKGSGSGLSGSDSSPETPVSKTPILPLSIISTSFLGIALMDYKKKGEEELNLVKDDALRVFKRYNHWSYAIKEEGGDRGTEARVFSTKKSWLIGKVSIGPATPSTSVSPPLASSIMDDTNQVLYPLIDADPHASRVIEYTRPSDYATWAGYTTGTPAVFWAWERIDRTGFRMRPLYYAGA